jgi:hypothetical protein
VSANAAPVNVPLDFVGPGPNSLTLNASAQGVVVSDFNGKIIRIFSGAPETNRPNGPAGPQTDFISLVSPVSVASSPDRSPVNATGGAETANVVIDSTTWSPLGFSNVNLDLLNGQEPTFNLSTLVLDAITLVGPFTPGFFEPTSEILIDIGGTFKSIEFFQDDSQSVIITGNSYQIPGVLRGVVDLALNIDAFGAALTIASSLTGQDFESPFTLAGDFGATTTGPLDADILMSGLVNGEFDLSAISTTLTLDTAGASVNLTLDVDASIDVNFEYFLFDTAHVPEPGTFVLLGVGAIGLIPVIRRRLRKS